MQKKSRLEAMLIVLSAPFWPLIAVLRESTVYARMPVILLTSIYSLLVVVGACSLLGEFLKALMILFAR